MNEEEILYKHIKDLANKAYSRGINTFTSFLSLTDLDVFYKKEREFAFVNYDIFGGLEVSERKIIRFGDMNCDFPIACIHVTPVQKKFSDKLGHRDYLGSLMNLGIKRETLGDIIISDKEAYIFCLDTIKDYIIDNLDCIKHTVVKCCIAESIPDTIVNDFSLISLNVSSLRLDAIIGEVYHLSRNQSQELIRNKKVFLNGRLTENNSAKLKEFDGVTVRGMGKFILGDNIKETKKGRYSIVGTKKFG